MNTRIVVFFMAFLCHAGTLLSNTNEDELLKAGIPFQLVGNLIVVEAMYDGKVGNFIFDTGAPDLILNKKYVDRKKILSESKAYGITGEVRNVGTLRVNEFIWSDLLLTDFKAQVADLSHIEATKEMDIMGLIGYKIYKEFEVLLDYKTRRILFFRLDENGMPLDPILDQASANFSTDIQMNGHFMVVEATIGEERLRLALDSGSEVNILEIGDKNRFRDEKKHIRKIQFKGVSSEVKEGDFWRMPSTRVGDTFHPGLHYLLADMTAINNSVPVRQLDGLLGFGFLSRFRVSINVSRRQITFWDHESPIFAPEILSQKISVKKRVSGNATLSRLIM